MDARILKELGEVAQAARTDPTLIPINGDLHATEERVNAVLIAYAAMVIGRNIADVGCFIANKPRRSGD